MDPDRVRYANGTLRPGGAEDKIQENRWDGMPPMPVGRGMVRQILHPDGDGGVGEL